MEFNLKNILLNMANDMNLTKVVYDLKDSVKNMPTQKFLTSEEFDNITNKDENTLYFVFED